MEYGRHLIREFMLDPGVVYLNHGTVGAPPRRVIEEQRRIQDLIELQPAQFQLRELADIYANGDPAEPHLRVAARAVAGHLGCSGDDLVFVDNATTGCNAVLRSFPFVSGDQILVTSLGYGGVTNAAVYAARVSGAEVVTVHLPGPGAPSHEYTERIADALTPRTRMAIVDHITSQTALVMPLKDIVEACHANGTLVLVDAAHTPGAIDVDIESYGADWYTANLHKWALTPRSAGVLWVAPQHHATTHPTVISWGLDNGIAAEFDLLGTRDPSPFLVAPFAFNLLEEWGGAALLAHNHRLVMEAASELSAAWGHEFNTPEEQIGPMANIALPVSLPHSADDAVSMQTWLREENGIEVPVFATDEGLRLRLSAQIYNDMDQFRLLRDAVLTRTAR